MVLCFVFAILYSLKLRNGSKSFLIKRHCVLKEAKLEVISYYLIIELSDREQYTHCYFNHLIEIIIEKFEKKWAIWVNFLLLLFNSIVFDSINLTTATKQVHNEKKLEKKSHKAEIQYNEYISSGTHTYIEIYMDFSNN